MKINHSAESALPTVNGGAGPNRAAAAAAAASGRTAPSTTTTAAASGASGVPVSTSAAFRALDGIPAGSGIDEAKVASMRSAIANGTFQVNAGAIADKLLANAQELLNHHRS